MDTLKSVVAAVMLVKAAASLASAADVRAVAFSREGNEIVVSYDLDARGRCEVLLRCSRESDGAPVRVVSVRGDVGQDVTPGVKKQIRWAVRDDHPGGLGELDVVLEVLAEETSEETPFTDHDEALASCLDRPLDPDCEKNLERLARRHLWLVLEGLEHEDPRTREGVARVLGRVGDARAAPPLLDLLERTDLPSGDNEVTERVKRRVQVTSTRSRPAYRTVRS